MKRLLYLLLFIPLIGNSQMVLRQPFFTDTTTTDDGFPDDYLAFYDFSGDVNDATGNYNATAYNLSYVNDNNGAANSAGSFNGSSTYVDLPEAIISEKGANFTISLWLYVANWNAATYIIGSADVDYLSFMVWYDDARMRVFAKSLLTTGDRTNNAWVHLLYTCTSGTMDVYVNGNYDAQVADVSMPAVTALNFGSFNNGASGFFTGYIDDVYFWDRGLTADEIALVYAAN